MRERKAGKSLGWSRDRTLVTIAKAQHTEPEGSLMDGNSGAGCEQRDEQQAGGRLAGVVMVNKVPQWLEQ